MSDVYVQANTGHSIELANDSQLSVVGDILGDAFTHDPVFAWFAGNPDIYAAFFRAEAEALYKDYGEIYISGEHSAAAMWLPPGVSSKVPLHWRSLLVFWKIFYNAVIQGCRRGLLIDRLCAEHHMREPHYYLHAIGVKLDYQGSGIGSALLKQGLLDCDAQHMPAYLESSNEKNNPLYERHGFEVQSAIRVPDGGPTLWAMKRAPRL
ncbi:MAG: N-acetyltransferase [Pseudomonadales bacterium]|nr:MAG: N-acetyltransferase [Pseudomonadales bacterium]